MANSNDVFNGTTLSFGGTVNNLRDVSFSKDGNPIDLTVSASTNHVYATGIPDIEVTCEVIGVSTIDVGDTGALTITYPDTSTDELASAICTEYEHSGSVDSELTTSLTFKPQAT